MQDNNNNKLNSKSKDKFKASKCKDHSKVQQEDQFLEVPMVMAMLDKVPHWDNNKMTLIKDKCNNNNIRILNNNNK